MIFKSLTNRRLLKPGAVPTKFSFSKSTPSRKKTKYEFRQSLLPQDTTIEEKTRDVTVQTDEDFITGSSCLEDKLLLDSQNQLLVTMIKLRHGLTNNVLSYLINVSESTISRIFTRCIQVLCAKCRSVNIWPSTEQVKAFMPSTFVNHFSACRVIIDTCEYFIQKPKNPKQQQSSFSTYKNHNTVNALIGITPSGGISFISDLYNGSISDKEITLRSGVIEKLEPGDCVLADRGFTILKDNFEAASLELYGHLMLLVDKFFLCATAHNFAALSLSLNTQVRLDFFSLFHDKNNLKKRKFSW
uniref:DDE Tnp4 domain-containing protein n=1 Tax=Biomphalaria glabrata TaxID=6526 RepID=A0A2C9KFR3_BIOGL